MSAVSAYLRRLADHPGVPVALACQGLGFMAGLEQSFTRGLIGAAIMSVFWIPVLLTNLK